MGTNIFASREQGSEDSTFLVTRYFPDQRGKAGISGHSFPLICKLVGDLEAKIGKKVAKSEKWNLIVYEELNEQGSLPSELP